jgi:enterochelin esterase-like enzyme
MKRCPVAHFGAPARGTVYNGTMPHTSTATVIVAIAWVLLLVGPARGDGPTSPRLAALSARVAAGERGAEDTFWKQVSEEGTPIVEHVPDAKGRLLVTFLYRARPDIHAVAMFGAPDGAPGMPLGHYARLERLRGTSVFAHSALVDPAARITYILVPGDDFGPPTGFPDMDKRLPLMRYDALNEHPQRWGSGCAPSPPFCSRVDLPKAPSQPLLTVHRETPAGDLVEVKVASKALANERRVLVYTPPGFRPNGPVYPLVVMFDAEAALSSLGIPIVLDELIATRRIPPVAALLVGNANRGKELSANPAFADFVALDLVPWVRRSYHTTNDPRLTVVAGVSLGGLAAAFAAARHPAVYGNVLSQSGSYWWAPDDVDEGEALPRDYATHPKLPLRFWMEAGTFESGSSVRGSHLLGANRHMRDVLLARGYQVSYREFAGGHDYFNWRGTIGDGLIALLAKPPRFTGAPPASPGKPGGIEVSAARKTLIAQGPRMAILDGGAATVAWLAQQDAALTTEADVSRMGSALRELDHIEEAIALFEWNVQRFPASSKAHDNLADAYWRNGDRARAIAGFQRAVELDPKNEPAKQMLEALR